MGLIRDALNALVAPALEPLNTRVAALEQAMATLQVPADLAERLAGLEARPTYDPGINVAIDDALAALDARAAALEPALTAEQRADLGTLRDMIVELQEIAAGIKATPQ